jgi:hypothetical protein
MRKMLYRQWHRETLALTIYGWKLLWSKRCIESNSRANAVHDMICRLQILPMMHQCEGGRVKML